MKKIILYIAFLLPFGLAAQTLSIEDLWNKLVQTNTARQNQLDIRIADQELAIERLNRYPVVYGDANLQRNLIIPTTPVPAIAFNPSAQDGAILPLKFATKWNAKAGLQAEWKFFDPNRKTAVAEKNILRDKALIQGLQSTQNLKKEATLAYTSIILASLQHQAAVEDSILYAHIVKTLKVRYDAGRESLAQYITGQEEYERKKIQLYETWSVLREADYELQKYIELDDIKQLTSGIETIKKALSTYQNINYETQLNSLDIRLNDNDHYAIKRQLLPSLTFNAYYGGQYFNNELHPFQGDNWFGNSYANIALRIPLSAYLVQAPSLSKISSQKELNQLKMEESTKLDDIKQRQQTQKILAAEQKVKALERILLLSQENIAIQKIEYEAGRILLTDLNRSLSSHSSNQKELWQAEYDLIARYLD